MTDTRRATLEEFISDIQQSIEELTEVSDMTNDDIEYSFGLCDQAIFLSSSKLEAAYIKLLKLGLKAEADSRKVLS